MVKPQLKSDSFLRSCPASRSRVAQFAAVRRQICRPTKPNRAGYLHWAARVRSMLASLASQSSQALAIH